MTTHIFELQILSGYYFNLAMSLCPQRILVDCERLPGFYINTTEPNCDVDWILDSEAGSLLPRNTPIMEEIGRDIDQWKGCTPLFLPEKNIDIAYWEGRSRGGYLYWNRNQGVD